MQLSFCMPIFRHCFCGIILMCKITTRVFLQSLLNKSIFLNASTFLSRFSIHGSSSKGWAIRTKL